MIIREHNVHRIAPCPSIRQQIGRKRGFVDHTFSDTTPIPKFIEWRFGLLPADP